jgi:hypothetical protein
MWKLCQCSCWLIIEVKWFYMYFNTSSSEWLISAVLAVLFILVRGKWLISWIIGWLIGWFLGCLVGQKSGCCVHRPHWPVWWSVWTYTGLLKMIVGVIHIHSRCNPMWFLSMGLRRGSGLCSSSSHKYPGTEGTNQNRHWNHHMLQTVWIELDYRVDVCRITKGAHIEHL